MAQYIDKVTVVAEIDRLQEATMDKNQNFLSSYHEGIFDGLSMLENFLDTLEVKELKEESVSKNLEEELIKWHNNHFRKENTFVGMSGFYLTNNSQLSLAHHFAQWQKEQLIEKMCVFLESTDFCKYYNKEFVKEFKKAMEK